MEVKAIGFSRMSGNAKATGRPYDMARLLVMIPQQGAQSTNMQKVAFGYEVVEIEVKPESALKFYTITYPAVISLELEETMSPNQDGRAQFRKVATGFKLIAPGIADPVIAKAA